MAPDGNFALFMPPGTSDFVWGLHNSLGVPLGQGPQNLVLNYGMLMLSRGDGTV